MYVRISRFKLKPEGVIAVRDGYEKDVMTPVTSAKGNRFFCVLLSTEEERVGSQVTGWDSKEDWESFSAGGYEEAMKDWWWVFEERPKATFWEIKWPGKIQLDPVAPGRNPIYVKVTRLKIKPEGVAAVRENFTENVMPAVANSKGNRFVCLLLSADERGAASQISAWDSKENCDRYLEDILPKLLGKVDWAFEEMPAATFWEIKWPVGIQF